MDVRYNEGDWLNKIQATQLLGSDGANEEGLSVVGLLKKAAREVEKAEDDIARYDKDYAIRLDVRQYPSQYDGWGEKMYWLQQAVTKIPDELSSSVDYPFLQSMDQFVEKLSHFDIASETTPAKVAIPNPNYSADGMDRNGSLQQVSLTDLMYRKSPLTKYMKAEYFALQQESGVGCTYEEYEALAFASTAFEYTSFNEKKTDFVVNTVVNGATLALGVALPWKIAMGLGLISGGVNSYEALSGKAIGGRELSGKERILRGVFGALDLALVGYSGVKGFKNRGKTPEVPETSREPGKVNGPENYNQTREYWKEFSEFDGVKVYQRNDAIDVNLIDDYGRTNLQRMEKGLAPIGPDGKSINLHHMTQRNESSIAEVTQSFHQENSKIIHINPNSMPSGIDRNKFTSWKRKYWIDRAEKLKLKN
ncbi:MAG: HNH/ENDO VII family nuclease [Vagococcus sp.]|uniref:HNH/ENDO VII family nuclease n=1 Tax=Vagococcus sp. TaxID=1933889 RepID=UPI002FCB28BF